MIHFGKNGILDDPYVYILFRVQRGSLLTVLGLGVARAHSVI